MDKRIRRKIGVLVVLGIFAALALATPSIAPVTPTHDYALDSEHYKIGDDWYTDYPEIVHAKRDGRVYVGYQGGTPYPAGNQLILRKSCDLVLWDDYRGQTGLEDADLNLFVINGKGYIRVDKESDNDAAGNLIIRVNNVGIGTSDPQYKLQVVGDGQYYGICAEGGNVGVGGFSTATGMDSYYGLVGMSILPLTFGTTHGVYGFAGGGSMNYGVYGTSAFSLIGPDYAGYFDGLLHADSVTSPIKNFRIDHPLDPENKYLFHSCVESSDMMNIYNGNSILNDNGEAWVELPEWFEALNKEFRYQLTPIGEPGPNLYIAEEISGNRFKIAGGDPEMKVSWQVTGIRHDPVAEKYRVQVEVSKPESERGKYLFPDVYDMPETMAVGYHEPPYSSLTDYNEQNP